MVKARLHDPKKQGFLQTPCETGPACPNGTSLGVRMDDQVQLSGRVTMIGAAAKGVKVTVQRAKVRVEAGADSAAGEVGRWKKVSEAKVDRKGRFATKLTIPAGPWLVRHKVVGLGTKKARSRAELAVSSSQLVVGMPLMYVNYVNIMDNLSKNKINLYLTTNVNTANGCGSKANPCDTANTAPIPLSPGGGKAQPGDEGSVKLIYVLPTSAGTSTSKDPSLPFGMMIQKQNCVGKCSTYLPAWNDGLGGTSCSKVSPAPAYYMTPGSEWTVYINQQITGYNALLANPNMPKAKKDRWAKHSASNGCVFAIQTEFDNWVANLGPFEWIALALVGALLAFGGWVAVVAGTVAVLLEGALVGTLTVVLSVNAIPDPPSYVDVGACNQFAKQLEETTATGSSFAGMILQPGSGRTSMYFRDTACTVPDDLPGGVLRVTNSLTMA